MQVGGCHEAAQAQGKICCNRDTLPLLGWQPETQGNIKLVFSYWCPKITGVMCVRIEPDLRISGCCAACQVMSGKGQVLSWCAKTQIHHPVIGGKCVKIGNSYPWPIWVFFLSIGDYVNGIWSEKGGLPALCSGMWESTGLPWKPAVVNGALQLQQRIYSARPGVGNLNHQSTGKMAHFLPPCLPALQSEKGRVCGWWELQHRVMRCLKAWPKTPSSWCKDSCGFWWGQEQPRVPCAPNQSSRHNTCVQQPQRDEKQNAFPACITHRWKTPQLRDAPSFVLLVWSRRRVHLVKAPKPKSETNCAVSPRPCSVTRDQRSGEWFTVFRCPHLLTLRHSDLWSAVRQQQHYFCSAAFITIYY